MRRRGGSRRRE
jgi:hypothetical protein